MNEVETISVVEVPESENEPRANLVACQTGLGFTALCASCPFAVRCNGEPLRSSAESEQESPALSESAAVADEDFVEDDFFISLDDTDVLIDDSAAGVELDEVVGPEPQVTVENTPKPTYYELLFDDSVDFVAADMGVVEAAVIDVDSSEQKRGDIAERQDEFEPDVLTEAVIEPIIENRPVAISVAVDVDPVIRADDEPPRVIREVEGISYVQESSLEGAQEAPVVDEIVERVDGPAVELMVEPTIDTFTAPVLIDKVATEESVVISEQPDYTNDVIDEIFEPDEIINVADDTEEIVEISELVAEPQDSSLSEDASPKLFDLSDNLIEVDEGGALDSVEEFDERTPSAANSDSPSDNPERADSLVEEAAVVKTEEFSFASYDMFLEFPERLVAPIVAPIFTRKMRGVAQLVGALAVYRCAAR